MLKFEDVRTRPDSSIFKNPEVKRSKVAGRMVRPDYAGSRCAEFLLLSRPRASMEWFFTSAGLTRIIRKTETPLPETGIPKTPPLPRPLRPGSRFRGVVRAGCLGCCGSRHRIRELLRAFYEPMTISVYFSE